ncbi:hypothetical protein CDAR_215201 [Caerostris darwini]|uniref:Uncharacterized protein n=1 Tax=Caerostris darwini TaxID=1538125 RepID=A0AAV4RWH8_9ARAC|nr:hypothetical protein CDAR_215201 [Caerostris darwini]
MEYAGFVGVTVEYVGMVVAVIESVGKIVIIVEFAGIVMVIAECTRIALTIVENLGSVVVVMVEYFEKMPDIAKYIEMDLGDMEGTFLLKLSSSNPTCKQGKKSFSQTYVGRNNAEESEKDCCSQSLCLSSPTELLHGRWLSNVSPYL